MKNMDNFCYEGKPLHAFAKLILCYQKDEQDTKGNTGKSIKNARTYVLQFVFLKRSPQQLVKIILDQSEGLSLELFLPN